MRFCLDSWAVLHWLEHCDRGARRVEQVMASRPVMSWVNIGEVYYVVARGGDAAAARATVDALRFRVRPDELTPDRIMGAAAIKADHRLAYADAFALETARAHEAVLLTGNPEILEMSGEWRVEDLR